MNHSNQAITSISISVCFYLPFGTEVIACFRQLNFLCLQDESSQLMEISIYTCFFIEESNFF